MYTNIFFSTLSQNKPVTTPRYLLGFLIWAFMTTRSMGRRPLWYGYLLLVLTIPEPSCARVPWGHATPLVYFKDASSSSFSRSLSAASTSFPAPLPGSSSSSSNGGSSASLSRGGSTKTIVSVDDGVDTLDPEAATLSPSAPLLPEESTTASSSSIRSSEETTSTARSVTGGAFNSSVVTNNSQSAAETTPPGTKASTSAAVGPKKVTTEYEQLPRHGLWKLIPRSNKNDHKRIAKTLKNRNHTNKRRKFMHASFGLLFATLNHVIPRSKFVPGMAALSSATLLMELLRYRNEFGWMNDVLHFVLGKSLRKHEMEGKFTGSFYFFTGVTLTAYLFPPTAATLGICQLAIADPTASYFGRQTRHVYWSRIENGLGGFGRNKGILGFLGGAACCVPFNYRVLKLAKFGAVPVSNTAVLAASVALGLAGALADLAVPTPALVLPKKVLGVRVPPFHLDDNFVVPVMSGWACVRIFDALGWSHTLALAPLLVL